MEQTMRRYQRGHLEEMRTSRGPVWFIRFREPNGYKPRFRVGSSKEYPTKLLASQAAEHIRERFNEVQDQSLSRTFGDVLTRYEQEEMPKRYSTRSGYQRMIDLHLRPRWGETSLDDLDPVEVRSWLRQLDYSPRTRGNLLDFMRHLYKFAMFWRWAQPTVNPLTTFRLPGSSKRTKRPRVITPAEFEKLYSIVESPQHKMMLVGAYMLGLRVSELNGLRWSDFEEQPGRVVIQRAIVEGHIGPVKTFHSGASLPLVGFVEAEFRSWRSASKYQASSDWVFASPSKDGELPLDSKWIQREVLKPCGRAIGLQFNLGWHALRHSYKVLLELVGTEPTVQRDLMRHADIRTTLQHYGEVHYSRLKEANEKAVALAMHAFEEGSER